MKLEKKIQISCSKAFCHLFCAYFTLIGFGQPVCSAPAVDTSVSPPSTSSSSIVTAVPYVRKSRDTAGLSATSSPESMDGQEQFIGSSSGGRLFPYPSFKHKYQTRMSRFHEDRPATRTYSIRSMTSFPKLNPLAGILSLKSSETRYPPIDELENQEQDPTFTPFISARALSNIPQFFQHLRSNLEALQFGDEDEESEEQAEPMKNERPLGLLGDSMYAYGTEDEGKMPNIPPPESKQMRWRPVTAGMTGGRAHVRHFVNDPLEPELFYRKPAYVNPARNVYEFGLG